MIEVFESEILSMVKKSQLKNVKLRCELDHDRVINYLKVICNSSARFYIRKEELKKYIANDDMENIDSTIEILNQEGSRLLNLVSNNKLDCKVVDEIITKMIEEHYLANMCNY